MPKGVRGMHKTLKFEETGEILSAEDQQRVIERIAAYRMSLQDALNDLRLSPVICENTQKRDPVFSDRLSGAIKARGPVPSRTQLAKFDALNDKKVTSYILRHAGVDHKFLQALAKCDPDNPKDRELLVRFGIARMQTQRIDHTYAHNTYEFAITNTDQNLDMLMAENRKVQADLEKLMASRAKVEEARAIAAPKQRETIDAEFEVREKVPVEKEADGGSETR